MGKEKKIAGLENLSAISENAEGTVYKGKRVVELETVVKILPIRVDVKNKEAPDSEHYLREIKRLKYLNQVPNIHVVKIINAGLSDEDSYPYIESEFVSGPDIDELLNFPKDPIFKIADTIDLAAQMADALAHCHKAMVRHGRINSHNIKLNSATGNYILINFGRILLTNEQRKEALKATRASEFLAPEQLQGEILYETDIYSFGVLLFQVLTGTLPQQRPSSAEGAAPVISIGQQIKERRQENLPVAWSDELKSQEMKIPVWLLNTVAICLQEEPSKRYSNGIKLQEALKLNWGKLQDPASTKNIALPPQATDKKESTVVPAKPVVQRPSTPTEPSAATVPASAAGAEKSVPAVEKSQDTDEKEAEIKRLKALLIQKEGQLDVYKYQTADYNPDSRNLNISRPLFFTILALIAALAAFAAYAYFFRQPDTKGLISTYTDDDTAQSPTGDTSQYKASEMYSDSLYKVDSAELVTSLPPIPESENESAKEPEGVIEKTEVSEKKKTAVKKKTPEVRPSARRTTTVAKNTRKEQDVRKPEPSQNPEYFEPKTKRTVIPKYTLAVPKAYFYDKPDVRTRRPVYLVSSNDSEFTASEDTNGFIYVVFFNTDREISKGWLRKVDLRRIN